MTAYKVWECVVCGFIYDESEGLPQEGIAPGTRWEDVPEDWLCPECGVGKMDFEMIEVKEVNIAVQPPATDTASNPVLEPMTHSPEVSTNKDPFKIWECIVCGWQYDEALGWPEDGIAPGTRWEDVPEDWVCPECGVGKLDFEMVAISESPVVNEEPSEAISDNFASIDSHMLPIIVVGSGLAGYNFARQYRQLDQQRPVLIVSQDDASFYSKPALSTGMHKGKSAVGLITKEAENMARELALDIRPFCNVTALNTSSKVISTNQGDFEYHQLILATGSLAIRPPMEGNATEKVYQVNNLSEYAAFRAAVVGAKRVVIIGAGLIGAEFCNDLALSGYQIDIIDPLPHMLGNLIPAAASQAVENAYQELGVNMHFNTTATRVDSQGRGYNVTLANGDVIECDAVLSAVGVRPNTAIASSAGLEVARGIVTNSLGQTSHPDIFALGDCAELGGQVRLYVAPLVSSAEAIAKTICGHSTEITLPNTPVTIKTTHHPVVVAPVAREAEGEWVIDKSSTTGVAAKFVSSSGEVVGFALTGTSTAEKESYLAML